MGQALIAQIDALGGISASWVLVGVTTVAGTLFWSKLNNIDKTLKTLTDYVQLHDKKIALLEVTKKDKDEDE